MKQRHSQTLQYSKVLAQNFQLTLASILFRTILKKSLPELNDNQSFLPWNYINTKNSHRSRRNYFSCESSYTSLCGQNSGNEAARTSGITGPGQKTHLTLSDSTTSSCLDIFKISFVTLSILRVLLLQLWDSEQHQPPFKNRGRFLVSPWQ